MEGDLSQMIWIAAAINAHLSRRLDPADFYPANPVFHHCQSVDFVRPRLLLGDQKIADEPRSWLSTLRAEGAVRAHLQHTPSENPGHSAAKGEQSTSDFSLLIDYPGQRQRWTSEWHARRDTAHHGKIWTVRYKLINGRAEAHRLLPGDLAAHVSALEAALVSMRHFAGDRNQQHWADSFQRSAAILRGKPTFPEHVIPVCLDAFPIEAQRILAACYNTWIFGGMSSWEELIFDYSEDNKTHIALTRLLRELMTRAIVDSVNSFSQ